MRARLLLANLRMVSRPALVVPWLIALRVATRADAVLIQECSTAHARLMRRLSPRWLLVREGGTEAVWVRRRHASDPEVVPDVSGLWLGHHTDRMHEARTLPLVTVRRWLRVGSVHFPPGWLAGPKDRRSAGRQYLAGLRALTLLTAGPTVLGGDFNARPGAPALARWRRARGMTAAGRTIDHAALRECRLVSTRRFPAGPGMDHRPRLVVVADRP